MAQSAFVPGKYSKPLPKSLTPERDASRGCAAARGYRAAFGIQINEIKPSAQFVTELSAIKFADQMRLKVKAVGFGLNAVNVPI